MIDYVENGCMKMVYFGRVINNSSKQLKTDL